MKNKIIFSLFIIFVICGIYAGRKNDSRLSGIPEFSDEYLVGFSYGGNGGFGSMSDVQSAKVIICTNHEVLVFLPDPDSYWSVLKHDEPIAVFTLTDEEYANIERVVDRRWIYKHDVKDSAVDGRMYGLYLYGTDNEVIKYYGACEPGEYNTEFWDIYNEVLRNSPLSEVCEVRDKWARDFNIRYYANGLPLELDDDEEVTYGTVVPPDNKFYCVFIKKIEPEKNEYLREVFFYWTPDNELKMLEVDFPPANEYGADRYVHKPQFQVKTDDVNFDGESDLMICLGDGYWCTYLYKDGEYVYNRSFEQICGYEAYSTSEMIKSDHGVYVYDEYYDLFMLNYDKSKIIEEYGYQMYTICDNKDIWVCENGNYVIADTDKDGYLEVLRQIEGDEDDLTTVFEFSEEGLLSEYETQEEFHMVKGLFDEPSNENVYYSLYTLVFNG